MQGLVRLFPTVKDDAGVNRLAAQVILKHADQQPLEAKAWEIYEFLRMKSNFSVGTTEVILCRAGQPEYIEYLEDQSFLYGIDLQILENDDMR